MRSVVFLIFFFTASLCDLDFNSKVRNFSIEILYHTLQVSDEDVVIISPYAIWSLLISLAYETLGVSREQVLEVLSLTEERSEVVQEYVKLKTSVLETEVATIKFLNFIFHDEYLNVYPESIGRLQNEFGFITESLRFEETKQAALSALQSMRSYQVSPISFLTAEDFFNSTMIMCNAISFSANWAKNLSFNVLPLNVSEIIQESFEDAEYDLDGMEEDKELLYVKTQLRFSNIESLHASVTELPYEDEKYCLLLLQPHTGYDAKQVFKNLREVSLKDILGKLQSDTDEFGLREVEVKLPSGITSHVILNKPLSNMGLSDVFDQGNANFDNFVEDMIYIGEISHRLTVVFYDSQTVVHSAIPAHPINRRINPAKDSIIKDQFIFFIIEKSTASILFGGSYSMGSHH